MPSPTDSSRDYISTLPPELIDMICQEVEIADISNLRLTCKFLHDVATAYFLHCACVYFKKDSFERLIEISKHPRISQNVYELIYVPDVLDDIERDSWEALVPINRGDMPMPPSPSSGTERDWRAYRRDIMRTMRPLYNPYTLDARDEAWEAYQGYVAEQNALRCNGYGSQELQEAIARLPRLKKVYMNHGSSLWSDDPPSKDEKRNPFHAALAHASGDHFHHHPSGVFQIRSLMLAIHQAGLQLHTLQLGDLSWKFLKEDEDTLEKMKTVLKSVHDLALHISVGYSEDYDIGLEIPECRSFLSNNKLYELLRAAPDISVLDIEFAWYEPFAPAAFKNVFHDFTWSRLHSLKLECIDASAHDMLPFFERHASTLRWLSFRSIRLLDGEWPDVLEGMQKCLKLKVASVSREILGSNPTQEWRLEPDGYESSMDMRVQANRTRTAIEYFLVHGGTCPLRDEVLHPQVEVGFW